MFYRLARPLLFALDPETAHRFTLESLHRLNRIGLGFAAANRPLPLPVRVMGIDFPNPVGLAAGMDKNGEFIDALATLGFGFIEIGCVTPRPQPGNPRPRLFRLQGAEAVINRLGFNNLGVDRMLENIRRARYRGVLAINMGKNADTPIERAVEDYRACMRSLYPVASFLTANISSPNTVNLRALQGADELDGLLAELAAERDVLATRHGRRVPLAVKVAPDLADAQIETIAGLLRRHRIDALIATNTTLSRDGVSGEPQRGEAGGLSGAPLKARSTAVIARFARELAGALPIIGVGGIASAADAQEKLDAGASLVQLYTALLYRGPGLVADIIRGLARAGAGAPAASAARP